MRLLKFLLLAMGMTVSLATGALAQTAIEGGNGLFFVDKAKTIGDGAIGVGLSLANQRFWLGDNPVTETVYAGSVTAGFGDRFEFSLAAPYRSQDPDRGDTVSGMGDGMAKAKYELLHHQEFGLRLSAAALLTLPLGDKDKGLGSGQAFPGVALLLDKEYENVTWSFNAGYVAANKTELGYDPYAIWAPGSSGSPSRNRWPISPKSTGKVWSDIKQGRDDSTTYHLGARYYINDNVSAHAAYGSWGGGQYSSYRYLAGVTVGVGLGRKATEAVSTGLINETGPAPVVPVVVEAPAAPVMTITLGTALFPFDKSILTDDAKAVIDANVAILNAHPEVNIVVEGHTDSTGSEAYNQKLGMRRALSAKKYLVTKGIAPERITPTTFGESRPVADNATREGRAKNRRADFVIQDE